MSDQIDDAIEATDKPTTLVANFMLNRPEGGRIYIVVPIDFDADMFETAVATLMQLRVAADQRRQASAIVTPDRKLLGLDGSPLKAD